MRNFTLCGILIAALISGRSSAQTPCGSDGYNQHLAQLHPAEAQQAQDELDSAKNYLFLHGEGQRANAAYVIPVVFHIIHDYGSENISDAQVRDAIAILNRDFAKLNPDTVDIIPEFTGIAANTDIEFRLATLDPNGNCTNGIEHIASKRTYNADDLSKLNPWPRNAYLNIWVVKSIGNQGVEGYATLPASVAASATASVDGIIILNDYVGSIGTGNITTTRFLTHQAGHYLGLIHTWGTGVGPGVACGDDGIPDTPITKGWATCPSSSTQLDICTPGIKENYQNYMEVYFCMRMFTADQATAMHATLNSTVAERDQLCTTTNLMATGTYTLTTANCAPKADFHCNHSMVCQGGNIMFYDDSWNGAVTTRTWYFPGGNPSTSTSANPAVTYAAAGWYPVSLTVSNANGSDSLTRTGYIIVGNSYGEVMTPAVEGFDSTNALNHGWYVVNYNNDGIYWHQTNSAHYTGAGCAVLDNFNNTGADIDELISPEYNLQYMTGITLSFRVAFATKNNDSTLTEKLRVLASSNCGQSWTVISNLRADSLLSAGLFTGYFIPTDTSDWKQFVVTVPGNMAQSRVRFKFEFTGGQYGNEFFLDDVNITGTNVGVNEYSSVSFIDLFPNPAQNSTTLQLSLKEKEKITVTMTDLDGRSVKAVVSEEMNTGEHVVSISTADLSTGMYMIIVDDGITKQVKKLVVSH
jgi:PKD repeat protein